MFRNEPHGGYSALRTLIGSRPHFVVTSNIDGYFRRAGFAEENVWETVTLPFLFEFVFFHSMALPTIFSAVSALVIVVVQVSGPGLIIKLKIPNTSNWTI